MHLRCFNPYAEIRQTENRLHWQQEGAVYLVTFRLADAVPHSLRSEWENEREAWFRGHPQPWSDAEEHDYHKRFSGAMERWLDAGHGSCVLRNVGRAEVIATTLRHVDGERLALVSFVVMPNHVHVLFVQHCDWPLEVLLRSGKGFSARSINSLLGREGRLWQPDYFDRLVRDEKHFTNCVRYIRRNPVKAGFPEGEYVLYESSLAGSIE